VDRALWLLLWLRFRAWLRRLGRTVRTPRGALLAALGVALFLLWLLSALLLGEPAHDGRAAEVRRYGPWALVGYCLVNLILTTGENALAFSAAEVNLLFPAPLSRRQLLLYKISGAVLNAVVSGLFFTIFLRQYAAHAVAALVGLTLAVLLLQLFAMLLALLASVVGARAYNRRRKLVLALLVAVAVVAGFRAFGRALTGDWRGLADDLDREPLFQVLLAPANWFVLAFSAEHLWPDLVQWAALALAVDGVLLLLIRTAVRAAATAAARRPRRGRRWRRRLPLRRATAPLPGRHRPDLVAAGHHLPAQLVVAGAGGAADRRHGRAATDPR
jgi:hypothetical protein